MTAAGQGLADVSVFDAANLDDSLSGNPLTVLTLFADTPRALAASQDGATVYAAPLFSGNGATTLHRDAVINRKPAPLASIEGVRAPDTGLIVKFDGVAWCDEAKTDWSSSVQFSLPDSSLTTAGFSPNSTQHVNVLFTPDNVCVKTGRRLLFDADFTSSNGTSACSSCHTFADMDHFAWDLGNPDDPQKTNTNAYVPNNLKSTQRFHPMNGPMTTQTLRGMVKNGPTHWRGDRIGGT